MPHDTVERLLQNDRTQGGESPDAIPNDTLLDHDVIKLFRLAIHYYRKSFKNDDKIPFHRRTDLIVLESLLVRKDLSHQELFQKINDCLNKILTGLIYDGEEIIATNRSQLRSIFKQVLKHESFNQRAMKERDERREQLIRELNEAGQTVSREDIHLIQEIREESQLKDEIIAEHEKTITTLKESNAFLEERLKGKNSELATAQHNLTQTRQSLTEEVAKNATLRLKIVSLQENNKKLQAKVESLQKQYADAEKKNERLQKENQQHSQGQSQTHARAQTVKPESAKTPNKSSWFSW